jgi:hypothetical protein
VCRAASLPVGINISERGLHEHIQGARVAGNVQE